jgi:pimeloyl-ACP methyl ester carboxylesterase
MPNSIAGPTSHTFISQRLKLHYVDWGNAKAPPLILQHGGQDHCRSWDWLAQRLRGEWHVIAPDLRGHGDSEWSQGGNYSMSAYIYDLAQLIHQEKLAPVTIVAHSLGGNIALRYAGIIPENVRRIVAIEGLGLSPKLIAEAVAKPFNERMRNWIERRRALAARMPKRYATLEEAVARMREANKRLSPEQARHLTEHGMSRNEDGTWSWKFDNALRVWPPYEMPVADVASLWSAITAPTMLVYGSESTASNPMVDGRIRHFKNAQIATIAGAGHWVHHDRLDAFETLIRPFIAVY